MPGCIETEGVRARNIEPFRCGIVREIRRHIVWPDDADENRLAGCIRAVRKLGFRQCSKNNARIVIGLCELWATCKACAVEMRIAYCSRNGHRACRMLGI